MQTLRLRVANEVGLHARPAALFVQTASAFQATIRARNATVPSDWVDAKSILGVLTLGVEKDHMIELDLEGADEATAAAAIQQLIESDFKH
jgi:phosphotransferase system HPr (HPr) family protein